MTALRIAMVVGETSGDILGAQVMDALKKRVPDIEFEGIGGPLMCERGFSSWFEMDRLAVMGLIEPLKRLPELLRIRKHLKTHWLSHPPDLFVGIDAPDFNLNIEASLKARGIPTAHLVCPTVWAWRAGRVKTIAKACRDLLCLFPFEPQFFSGTDVRAHFVGHPMVEALADLPSNDDIRRTLKLSERAVLALLPGSRQSEIELLLPIYLQALEQIDLDHQVVIPASTPANFALIKAITESFKVESTVIQGHSRELLKITEGAIVTSGTATLEAALLACPMIIAYRMSPLSWWLIKRLLHTPFAGLPNIILNRCVVPELIQDALTPSALATELKTLLHHGGLAQKKEFQDILAVLNVPFGDQCAGVLLNALRA